VLRPEIFLNTVKVVGKLVKRKAVIIFLNKSSQVIHRTSFHIITSINIIAALYSVFNHTRKAEKT